MKLMRSPIVVGILVVVALLLVGNSLMSSRSVQNMWNRTFSKPARTAAKPAPVPKPTAKPAQTSQPSTPRSRAARTPATGPAETSTPAVERETMAPVDVASVRANAARWVDSPRRDPFLRRSTGTDRRGPRAADLLTLTGIWRQTDSTLAVINNRVVSEGEVIQGFNIAGIEIDRVWVEGPDGREAIEFKVPLPNPAVIGTEPEAGTEGVTPANEIEDEDNQDLDDPEPGRQRVVT